MCADWKERYKELQRQNRDLRAKDEYVLNSLRDAILSLALVLNKVVFVLLVWCSAQRDQIERLNAIVKLQAQANRENSGQSNESRAN